MELFPLHKYGVASNILDSIIAFANLLIELIWSCLSCVLSTIAFANILIDKVWSCFPYFGFYNCVCEYTY